MDKSRYRGELKENEPMARHTSWRCGGHAKYFYKPADVDDLAYCLSQIAEDEPLVWVGLGSNLLVRDGGIPGWVIHTHGILSGLEVSGDGLLRAEAGVACNKVAKFCVQNKLTGGEFLAGIPGTVGGALAMNAGAFGGETWDYVEAVETIDEQGQRHHHSKDRFKVGYRSVSGPEKEWFTAGYFRFQEGDAESGMERIKALLEERNDKQPIGAPSCGSVFRNPPGDYAARLIDSCGLKGERRGGAVVSPKHANFIINEDNATAADIETLLLHVQARVKQQTGVELQPEVRIVGQVG